MGEGDEQGAGGWLAELGELADGVLLSPIIGRPATRALSRLIAGAADIPIAALSNLRKRIDDDAQARSLVTRTVAASVAEAAAADPQVLERGLIRWAGVNARQQINREDVARKTLKYLREDPPPPGEAGPTDDFLNLFETQAERASSEEMRDLFARILAGECRKAGSFSLATLQLIAVMDQRLAGLVAQARSWVVAGDFIVFMGEFTRLTYLGTLSHLSDFNIVRMGMINRPMLVSEGRFGLSYGPKAIVASTTDPSIALPIAPLTQVGREIMSLVPFTLDEAALREVGAALKASPDITAVGLADVAHQGTTSFEVTDVVDI
jgi:hypothetical protein